MHIIRIVSNKINLTELTHDTHRIDNSHRVDTQFILDVLTRTPLK